MDTTTLSLIALASLAFVSIIAWKALWLIRKSGEAPPEDASAEDEA